MMKESPKVTAFKFAPSISPRTLNYCSKAAHITGFLRRNLVMTIAGSFLDRLEWNSQSACNSWKTRFSPNFIRIGSKLRVSQRFKGKEVKWTPSAHFKANVRFLSTEPVPPCERRWISINQALFQSSDQKLTGKNSNSSNFSLKLKQFWQYGSTRTNKGWGTVLGPSGAQCWIRE